MVDHRANDRLRKPQYVEAMAKIVKIHTSKQPRRPHFIQEWASRYHLRQADLAREIGVDKSVVNRWWAGASPGEDHQANLAARFMIDRDDLFRHPHDAIMKNLFRNRKKLFDLLVDRDDSELDRIEQLIALTVPRKDGTNG